jgi:predicted branched-subunit amino acid permease
VKRKTLLREGYVTVAPLMVGVSPFGVVFGALAAGAGLDLWQAVGMSILVIAGSSQIVGVGLIGESAPFAIIVLTTFIINLRHFLYSASLANFVRPLSLPHKAILGYFMIDEVYAGVLKRYQTGELSPDEFFWYFLGGGLNLASLWYLTTAIGWGLGNVIPASTREILEFTLPLIFLSIVVPLLVNMPRILTALSAGVTGIVFAPLPHNLNLILAACVGIIVGVLAEQYQANHREAVQA